MNTLNHAKQLQSRTKAFAVRIITAFARLPKDEAARLLGDSFSVRELLSPLTIDLHAGRALRPILFRKSASSLKKPMKVSFGLNCWEAELVKMNLVKPLMKECEELLKIFSTSLTTAKRNR